jgi:DNA-binding NtrC family response regulator
MDNSRKSKIEKSKIIDEELDNLRNSMEKVLLTIFSELNSIRDKFKVAYLTDDGSFPTIEEMEGWLIVEALKKSHGNRYKASKLLGIGERTLYRRIKELELENKMENAIDKNV